MTNEVLGAESADDDSPLSNEEAYDQLANHRRRYALHYLKQTEGPVDIRDLAEQVAAWENGTDVASLSAQERKRVYIALYQSHLPSMDEAGLVAYDDDGTVELTDTVADADIYMQVIAGEDIPWDLYYLGLSAANGLLLALAWLGVQPFTRIPGLGWGVVVLVSFALSAFVQLAYRRRMHLGDEGPPPELPSEG